jgi:hypothetical protein
VFPTIQKSANMLRIRVPVDDTHTAQWYYIFRKLEEGHAQPTEDIPVFEMPSPEPDERGQPRWDLLNGDVDPQDNAIFASEPIYDRRQEMLGESDRGVILFRHFLDEQIRIVEQGGDPMNVFRDPEANVVLDLHTERDGQHMAGRGSRMATRDTPTFSSRYKLLVEAPVEQPRLAAPVARANA